MQLIDSSISPYDEPLVGSGPFGGHGEGHGDEHESWQLNAWPNPAHHCINVSYEGFNSRDAYLVIRNVTGQPVYANRVSLSGPSGTYSIDLPGGLSSGIYFLQMQSLTYSRVVKILLQ